MTENCSKFSLQFRLRTCMQISRFAVNCMIEICTKFTSKHDFLFNSNNSLVVKYLDVEADSECVVLDQDNLK